MQKKKVHKTDSSSKHKRKPSEYNMFIKKQLDSGKSMEEAAHAWTENKEENSEKKPEKIKLKQGTELEKVLVENLVQLQKINIGLSEKFDHLAREISSILALFEVTARNFTKNSPVGEYEKDKEFLEKIDKLLNQNKILAKGLSLMEERLRERMYGAPLKQAEEPEEEFKASIGKRPLPRF